MDSVLYTRIVNIAEGIKEVTILYESNNKLYVSYVISSPRGASGHFRRVKIQDHYLAKLALVEQTSVTIAH